MSSRFRNGGVQRRGRLAALAAGVAAAVTLLAPTAGAQAALLGSGSACNSATESQPFAAWGDNNLYEPITGGNFQSTTGWTLSGGAKIVSGGDPFIAAGAPRSLELPAGASATSPASCVNLSDPTLRFFDRLTTSTGAHIQVTLLYNNVVLGLLPPSAGAVSPSVGWQPSPTLTTASTVGTITSLFNAKVSLRFTAVGGPVQIADIYIDPRCI
jgi:hypothetical protein